MFNINLNQTKATLLAAIAFTGAALAPKADAAILIDTIANGDYVTAGGNALGFTNLRNTNQEVLSFAPFQGDGELLSSVEVLMMRSTTGGNFVGLPEMQLGFYRGGASQVLNSPLLDSSELMIIPGNELSGLDTPFATVGTKEIYKIKASGLERFNIRTDAGSDHFLGFAPRLTGGPFGVCSGAFRSGNLGSPFLYHNSSNGNLGTFGQYGAPGDYSGIKIETSVVPEPGSLVALGAGLVALSARRRNQKKD